MATQRLLFLTPAQAVTGIFPALRDAGFELGIAENLKGASAFISKSGPGIIFARPTLPGFRVEDLLAVGAEDPHFPPVIVVADKGSPQEAERLLNLGARDYWLEPLDVERVKIAAGQKRRERVRRDLIELIGIVRKLRMDGRRIAVAELFAQKSAPHHTTS